MLKVFQFRTIMVLAVVVLALAGADVALYVYNRALQQEVNERQVFLQQTVQAEVLLREMVKAMAELAVRYDDAEIMTLLQSQGIGVNAGPRPQPESPSLQPGDR